jgi:REP element-mobilizing transposase RayT
MQKDFIENVRKRQGAYLPHWRADGTIYFITFRLADSLPLSVIKEWLWERDDILKTAKHLHRELSAYELDRLEELSWKHIDEHLRKGRGACIFKQPEIAEILAKIMTNRNGIEYELFAWCIMPNHVHVVVEPLGNTPLENIMQSWKSISAHRINKVMKKRETLWQPEYYDHLVRNQQDLDHCIEYTWNNAEQAGIKNWKWRWKKKK